MLFSKSITGTMAALALATAIPVTSAQAGDHRYGSGRGYERSYDRGYDAGPRHGRGYDRYDDRRQYGYGQPPRRHRDRTGRNLAIGAFAAIVGLAIAAEANRPRRHYDRYGD